MPWFPPHVPVGARRARVARVSDELRRNGVDVRPVHIQGTHHRPQLLWPALVPPSGIVLGLREPPAAGPRVCPQRLRLSPGRPRRRGRRHGGRIGPLSRRRAHPEARAGRLEGHPGRVRGPVAAAFDARRPLPASYLPPSLGSRRRPPNSSPTSHRASTLHKSGRYSIASAITSPAPVRGGPTRFATGRGRTARVLAFLVLATGCRGIKLCSAVGAKSSGASGGTPRRVRGRPAT